MKVLVMMCYGLIVLMVVAACESGRAADAPVALPSPTPLAATAVAADAAPTLALTATPAAADGVDPVYAGLPETILAALTTADPARGQELTMRNGCIGCHAVDPNVKMAGPTWSNLAATVADRVEGQSAGLYLYHSLINPDEYVVAGYPTGLMVQTFGTTLSDQEMADILAYLLTLKAAN